MDPQQGVLGPEFGSNPLDGVFRSLTLLPNSPYTPSPASPVPGSINGLLFAPAPSGSDQSSALQSLLNSLNPNANNALPSPGGTLQLQPGTYLIQGLAIPTGVILAGAGMGNTILQLPNGATTANPVLQTKNFGTLTGTTPASGDMGPWGWQVRDLTIDGNKANNGSNTATAAFQIFGYDFTLVNVRVRNSNTQGLYSEWPLNAGAPALGDAMEARLFNLKVHDSVTHGVNWNGPHDSDIIAVNSYNNSGRGFWIQNKGNNSKWTNCHSWGGAQTYAWYLEGIGTFLLNCEGEGAITNQLFIGANDIGVEGGVWFPSGGGTTGVVIGDGGHASLTGTFLSTKLVNFTTSISFAQDLGGIYVCACYGTSGNAFTGTPAAASLVFLTVNGGIALPYNQIGTGTTFTKGQFSAGGLLQAQAAFEQTRVVVTYSASMAINASGGNFFDISATNGTAFTIQGPTGATDGQEITVTVRNISGGVLGAVTWGTSAYKLAAWTSPANTFSRSIKFRYSSTASLWVETSRTTVDVPN